MHPLLSRELFYRSIIYTHDGLRVESWLSIKCNSKLSCILYEVGRHPIARQMLTFQRHSRWWRWILFRYRWTRCAQHHKLKGNDEQEEKEKNGIKHAAKKCHSVQGFGTALLPFFTDRFGLRSLTPGIFHTAWILSLLIGLCSADCQAHC